MLYYRAEIFRQSPLRKNALAESARAQACYTFSGSLKGSVPFRYLDLQKVLFSPKVWRKHKKAHHLFTGGALDFSYLGKCFILRLRQNYLRGLLMAACAAARRAMGTRKGEQLT